MNLEDRKLNDPRYNKDLAHSIMKDIREENKRYNYFEGEVVYMQSINECFNHQEKENRNDPRYNPELGYLFMEDQRAYSQQEDYIESGQLESDEHYRAFIQPIEDEQVVNTDWTPVDDIWAQEQEEGLPFWKATSDRITELLES